MRFLSRFGLNGSISDVFCHLACRFFAGKLQQNGRAEVG